MELDDCAFPLLKGAVLTDDAKMGFKDANWCLLVGAKPRGPGMERADLLKDNGRIFITQGQIIDQVAADNARVAVVGNPANTNCMIAASQAKRLTADRFTAMVRLDQNRAQTQLAKKAGVDLTTVKDIFIYGNHSPTMFPAFAHAKIGGKPATQVITDQACSRDLSAKPSANAAPRSSRLAAPPRPLPPQMRSSIMCGTSSRQAQFIPSRLNRTVTTASTPTCGPACPSARQLPAPLKSSRLTRWMISQNRRSPQPTRNWSRNARSWPN